MSCDDSPRTQILFLGAIIPAWGLSFQAQSTVSIARVVYWGLGTLMENSLCLFFTTVGGLHGARRSSLPEEKPVKRRWAVLVNSQLNLGMVKTGRGGVEGWKKLQTGFKPWASQF